MFAIFTDKERFSHSPLIRISISRGPRLLSDFIARTSEIRFVHYSKRRPSLARKPFLWKIGSRDHRNARIKNKRNTMVWVKLEFNGLSTRKKYRLRSTGNFVSAASCFSELSLRNSFSLADGRCWSVEFNSSVSFGRTIKAEFCESSDKFRGLSSASCENFSRRRKLQRTGAEQKTQLIIRFPWFAIFIHFMLRRVQCSSTKQWR